MTFTTIRVDKDGLSDDRWQEYYDMLRRIQVRHNTILFSTSWQVLKQRIVGTIEQSPEYVNVVVLDNDAIVGWFDYRDHIDENKPPSIYSRFDAEYDEHPLDFTLTVAKGLAQLTEPYPDAIISTMTGRHSQTDIVLGWGGRVISRVDRYRLRRDRVDRELISRWRTEGAARNPKLRMVTFTSVPEEHLERYCFLNTTFLNDMPHENPPTKPFHYDVAEHRRMERIHREQGQVVMVAALLDETGRMIGHSNAYVIPSGPRDIYQAMTGIDPAYRGGGLAKWLKAELFDWLGRTFPGNETMTTEMRSLNEPIQEINRQMGFEIEAQGHEMELPVAALQQYVRRMAQ